MFSLAEHKLDGRFSILYNMFKWIEQSVQLNKHICSGGLNIMVEKEDNLKLISVETGEVFANAEDAQKARERYLDDLEEKRLKKNSNFIQVTKTVGTSVINQAIAENAVSVQILMFFLENMNNQNAIMVSQKTLTEVLGKSRTTIYNALKYLDSNGIVATGKIGTANTYIVNPEVAWQNSYQAKKYVKFNGAILLGKTENEELFKKFNKTNFASIPKIEAQKDKNEA